MKTLIRVCIGVMTMGNEAIVPEDAEPPRNETDLYGQPVAEEQIGEEYWEVYSSRQDSSILFVAYYKFQDGDWVKQGLDRHRASNLFNKEGWPTD